jgi:hypothetical protein
MRVLPPKGRERCQVGLVRCRVGPVHHTAGVGSRRTWRTLSAQPRLAAMDVRCDPSAAMMLVVRDALTPLRCEA